MRRRAEPASCAKVAKLERACAVNEEVAGFQITVKQASRMAGTDSLHEHAREFFNVAIFQPHEVVLAWVSGVDDLPQITPSHEIKQQGDRSIRLGKHFVQCHHIFVPQFLLDRMSFTWAGLGQNGTATTQILAPARH